MCLEYFYSRYYDYILMGKASPLGENLYKNSSILSSFLIKFIKSPNLPFSGGCSMNRIQYSILANLDSFPVIHSNWYPPVAVAKKNLQYAEILTPDLASAASEMTTVHQYLYQSWTLSNDYRTIRRVIQRIAVVEQHHFTIIGQLIALLGGRPECRSLEPDSYWCGNMVDYDCDLRTLLSKNAESEQFAAQAYAAQAKEINDPHVSKMLARLSLDEKLHHKIFSDFLSQIPEQPIC